MLKSNWASLSLLQSKGAEGRMWRLLRTDGRSLSSLIRASRHDSPRDAAIAEALPAKETGDTKAEGSSQGDAFSVDLDVDGVFARGRRHFLALEGSCLWSILPIRPTTAGSRCKWLATDWRQ